VHTLTQVLLAQTRHHPIVSELPLRLEPVTRDPFIDTTAYGATEHARQVARVRQSLALSARRENAR
jgi:hypothetical protein